MKKFFVFVLALAGVLGLVVPNSIYAQGGWSPDGPWYLELDGSIGDGGTYAVFIGITPKYGLPEFPCGFTARYKISDSKDSLQLTGEVHYSGIPSYPLTIMGEVKDYYYPNDNNQPTYLLNEVPPGSRPRGVSYMKMELIPDDKRYIDVFQKIIVIPAPIFQKMCDSGNVLGEMPIGPAHINDWKWEYKLVQ